MSYHEKTETAAKGKWKGILLELGVPEACLKNRHGPCPLCGGKDRFRWDNLDGRGTFICNSCGAGNGMHLAIQFTGQPFHVIAPRIDTMLGNLNADAPQQRQVMSDDKRKDLLRATLAATHPVKPGDLVDTYLATRYLDRRAYPSALRFGEALNDGEGGVRPCMVAMVDVYGETDSGGRPRPCSLHRTFLRPDGKGKAEMKAPRKLTPGTLPDGACVMLSDWPGYGAIGIAEGIETAMSASALFEMPVWAALNATMMEKWLPPEGAEEVSIFIDNDANFRGLRAGGILANKLRTKRQYAGLEVNIQTPTITGTDWADEWIARVRARYSP